MLLKRFPLGRGGATADGRLQAAGLICRPAYQGLRQPKIARFLLPRAIFLAQNAHFSLF